MLMYYLNRSLEHACQVSALQKLLGVGFTRERCDQTAGGFGHVPRREGIGCSDQVFQVRTQ